MPNESIARNEYYHPAMNFRKANSLINGRFNAGLLENQLLAMSLASVKFEEEKMRSHLTQLQVRRILGKEYSQFNKYIKLAAQRLLSMQIMMENPESKKWKGYNLLSSAEIDDGDITIIFNIELKDHILGYIDKFTLLNIEQLAKFDRVASFRLYETLKSHMWYPKSYKGVRDGKYRVEFSIAELRCLLGGVNMEHEEIAYLFNNKDYIDYEKIIQKAEKIHNEDIAKGKSQKEAYPAPKWAIPRDLREKVIIPAVEEITEKSDVDVKFEEIKVGRTHTIKGYIFYMEDRLFNNNVVDTDASDAEPDMDELIDEVFNIIDEKISIKDVRNLLRTADNDLEKIKKAYGIAKLQGTDNLIGFLVSAIKNDYNEPLKTKKKEKNTFEFSNQRNYDFEELERTLLNRQG